MKITLPIYWSQTFKTKPDKVWLCGMNAYRNWHHFTSNAWKTEFSELVVNQLPKGITFNKFTLDIDFYYKNVCDASNVVPLMEKVVLDVLQKEGILVNDNVNYHISTTWHVIAQDKENPRCEITIKDYHE